MPLLTCLSFSTARSIAPTFGKIEDSSVLTGSCGADGTIASRTNLPTSAFAPAASPGAVSESGSTIAHPSSASICSLFK